VNDDKQRQLQKLAQQVRNLEQSPLYDYRRENDYSSVIGEGDPNAELMFIGEAPGKQEAETGRPFVGAAGRILDELLFSIGLPREQVYITNVVKDRPPDNRDPRQEEIELYAPFLLCQIEQIIQPQVIATLGRFAMGFILDHFGLPQKGEKISELHGEVLQAKTTYGKVSVVPLYHPAAALYRRELRDTLEEDFRVLKLLIERQ